MSKGDEQKDRDSLVKTGRQFGRKACLLSVQARQFDKCTSHGRRIECELEFWGGQVCLFPSCCARAFRPTQDESRDGAKRKGTKWYGPFEGEPFYIRQQKRGTFSYSFLFALTLVRNYFARRSCFVLVDWLRSVWWWREGGRRGKGEYEVKEEFFVE